jgi:hypothetical protein
MLETGNAPIVGEMSTAPIATPAPVVAPKSSAFDSVKGYVRSILDEKNFFTSGQPVTTAEFSGVIPEGRDVLPTPTPRGSIPVLSSGNQPYQFDPMTGGEQINTGLPAFMRPKEDDPATLARNANVTALAAETKLPVSFVDKQYDELTKGLRDQPTKSEIVGALMNTAIAVGLYTNPVGTVIGVGSYMAAKELENAAVTQFGNEPYQFGAGKEVKDLAGSLAEPFNTLADVAVFWSCWLFC